MKLSVNHYSCLTLGELEVSGCPIAKFAFHKDDLHCTLFYVSVQMMFGTYSIICY